MQSMLFQQPSVRQVEFDDGLNTGHSYASKVASEGVAPRSRQARIGKELAGLAASLPITLSSSVFVRVDQTHMTLWKALITGESSVFVRVDQIHMTLWKALITGESSVFVRVDQTHMILWKALITGESSVFVRVDQAHMTLWKALIIGESVVACMHA